jgi:hypothetical protein
MPEKQFAAPWKDRFLLKYVPVVRELPALLRLQTLKPRSVPSPQTALIVNCCLIGDFVVSLPSICGGDVLDLTDVPAVNARPGRTVVVHTGSDSRVHLWRVDKWVALLERLHQLKDVSFVFVGGTEEEARMFDEISRRVSFPLHSVIRQYDLLEVVMLLRMSNLFVGVDSGPRHLAHLVDLPSVSLLGPGPKSFQPLNRNATVADETECKRCMTFYCPYAPSCVGKIEVHTVARGCLTTLMKVAGETSRPVSAVGVIQSITR